MEIFDYDNILLLPRKCVVESRSECDTSMEFGPHRFKLPVVPANMKTVLDVPIAEFLASNGYFYVMHRFDLDTVAFAKTMRDKGLLVSISAGVKPEDYAVIDRLAETGVGADYVTIDIAHGHAESVRKMIAHIKQTLPQAFVIAGNVGTPEAVIDLENWGADATKIGVGPGKVCITRLKTGFGTGGWQLSALKWCARVATKPIIADGGIRHNGDIAKSLRFGATMVMIGSLFAGHEESPGQTVEVDGKLYKEYYGSASDFNKGEYRHVEGKRILEPIKGRLRRHAARDAGRPAELDLVRRRTLRGRHPQGELRGPGRRERGRAPVHVNAGHVRGLDPATVRALASLAVREGTRRCPPKTSLEEGGHHDRLQRHQSLRPAERPPGRSRHARRRPRPRRPRQRLVAVILDSILMMAGRHGSPFFAFGRHRPVRRSSTRTSRPIRIAMMGQMFSVMLPGYVIAA